MVPKRTSAPPHRIGDEKKDLSSSGEASLQPRINPDLVKLLHLQALTARAHTTGMRLDKRIELQRAGIPADLLRCFDHLTKAGRLAVVLVTESGVCSSCHLVLPSGLFHALASGEHTHRCPHCGRFIYTSTTPTLAEATPDSSGEARSAPNLRAVPA